MSVVKNSWLAAELKAELSQSQFPNRASEDNGVQHIPNPHPEIEEKFLSQGFYEPDHEKIEP